MNKTLIYLLSAAMLLAPASNILGVDNSMSDVQKVTVTMNEKVMSDSDITLAVKDAIMKDKDLSKFSKDITVKVDKGIVTLSGKVDSVKIKDDLGILVKGVSGVKSVVNGIEVHSLMIEIK